MRVPRSFVQDVRLGSFDKVTLWTGSTGRTTFVSLCKWIARVVENDVIDDSFPFKLVYLDEATLHKVGISRSFTLANHMDTPQNWVEGLTEGLIEKITTHLSETQC